MPLINCPVCNAQISDDAEACPHCGHPLKETMKENLERKMLGTGVFVLVLAGFIICVLWAAGRLR